MFMVKQGRIVMLCCLWLCSRCHPCSLSYQFFKHEVYQTKGKPQAKNLHWDDQNVVNSFFSFYISGFFGNTPYNSEQI